MVASYGNIFTLFLVVMICMVAYAHGQVGCGGEMIVPDQNSMTSWQSTKAGEQAKSKCPNVECGKWAYRTCFSNGTWGRIDYGECKSKKFKRQSERPAAGQESQERCGTALIGDDNGFTSWQSTKGGEQARTNCPNGICGKWAYRTCFANGTWGRIDYSKCANATDSLNKANHTEPGTEHPAAGATGRTNIPSYIAPLLIVFVALSLLS